MNIKRACTPFLLAIFSLLLLATLLPACKSTPKVDWTRRVGNYSYDQAVAELGPPDKTAQLSDGLTVADWISHRSGGVSIGVGTGFYSGHTGVGVGQSVGTGYPDKVLRLTFGADHQLVSWSKNY